MSKLMKWVRTNGSLHLEVLVGKEWKHYKDSPLNTADAAISSKSGFATAQNGLRNGYKYLRVIEVVDFLKYKQPVDLFEEVQASLSKDLPVELNLEGVDYLHMDSLLGVVNLLKTVFEISNLKESLFFSGGKEVYRRELEDMI